jgi:hypothetical protein
LVRFRPGAADCTTGPSRTIGEKVLFGEFARHDPELP